MPTVTHRLGLALALSLTFHAVHADTGTPEHYQSIARELLEQLVEIDTSHPDGDNTAAVRLVAERLRAAGFPARDLSLIEPAPRKGNLVARYRSPAPTKPPLLLLAHIDVVGADPADWSVPPFEFTEQDGYWYGRGTTDDKDEAAIHATNFIRWKDEGFEPNRDIIMALTADEEGGTHNGVQYLLANHRSLIDAEFALNEGGGGLLLNGKRLGNGVQAAEKIYQSFILEVTNPGGHSSIPRPDNAIYDLAHALLAIRRHQFPVVLNEVTRASFKASAGTMSPAQAAAIPGLLNLPPDPAAVAVFAESPMYNAQLRTTCVATRLDAGHADNALPQRARATVNCRMLPGSDPATVRATLERVINNPGIALTPVNEALVSPASPLTEEIMAPITAITEAMWPGVPVRPSMSTGATDGLFLRNAGIPVYGTSGLFQDMNDIRAHGRDERIEPGAFYDGLEYLNRLVKALASDPAVPVAADTAEAANASILFLQGAEQVEAFRNQAQLTAVRHLAASPSPLALPDGEPLPPISIDYQGGRLSLEDYLDQERVAGLLVLQNGAVRYERYAFGNTKDTHWISFSVAKSVVSLLIGAAIKDGYIESIDEPVTNYLPPLADTPYRDVTLKQLLQMASGVAWNEDYADPESDVASADYATLALYDHLARKPRVAPPGGVFNYNTAETNLAGTLLRAAIGNNLSAYLEQKIWQPFGMADAATWNLTEAGGGEFGGCCINATLRDYARIGLFALADGVLADGTRVLPEGWMAQSIAPSAAYPGYGYFWWLGDDSYEASGIFGQGIRIYPEQNLVIAAHGARRHAFRPQDDALQSSMYDAIAASLTQSDTASVGE